jgi:hypothetical protein
MLRVLISPPAFSRTVYAPEGSGRPSDRVPSQTNS